MSSTQSPKKSLLSYVLLILKGALVGFGAILPGVSGGTLCVTFGMYHPIIETLSHPATGLKKHGLRLILFVLGVAIGFVGLSGLTATLLDQNPTLITCAFVGFIIGTFPELWQDAGKEGRTRGSIWALCIGFVVMLGVLTLLKTNLSVAITPGIIAYVFCGVLWGLSFIVPGLSSSSLLLFFGLYQPMLAGISSFDFAVLLPMGIGMALTVLLLSKGVEKLYSKFYNAASHVLLGIVAATTVMVIPEDMRAALLAIVVCAVASIGFSKLGQKNKV